MLAGLCLTISVVECFLTEIKYCIFSAELTHKLHTHKQSKLKRVEKKGSKGEQNDEDLTGREL